MHATCPGGCSRHAFYPCDFSTVWLETFLALVPPPGPYPKLDVDVGWSIEAIFMDFTKSFYIVMSNLYSVYYFSFQGDLCMVCHAQMIELIATRIIFIKFCCV